VAGVRYAAALRVGAEPLLTRAEAAALLGIRPKSVTKRADAGKLNPIRLPGGQRRYRESEVRAQSAAGTRPAFKRGGNGDASKSPLGEISSSPGRAGEETRGR
jgi:hypothetical protein